MGLRAATAAMCLIVMLTNRAVAQLPSASAAALGMADNFTAIARGYAAAAWNPAALGLPDNPRASLAVLPIRVIAGLDPVTLGDIDDFEGDFIPAAVREEWLQRISAEGSEDGTGGGDLTLFAGQYRRFAVQLGSTSRAIGDLSPGAAELILFGNYGRTDAPRALELSGSRATGFAVSTLAVSYGHPFALPADAAQLSVGVTFKYTVGHVLAHGEDRGTVFTEEPTATIDFPVVSTRTDGFDGISGGGLGMDVGAALTRGAWLFGAVLQNVFNTFAWDENELVFRTGFGVFDTDAHEIDFEERDFADAPAHLRAFIEDARFRPTLGLGAAYRARPDLLLTSDLRARIGSSTMEPAPATHFGVGAEYVPTRMVPLRAGVAYVSGGYQLAAGFGVNFGAISLATSIARRHTDLGVDTITMFTLISTTPR